MADDDVHRIKVQARTVEELREFLDGSNLDFACRPVARQEAGGLTVDVYATLPQVERLRSARQITGVTLDVIENASEIGRARQSEVGSGNRFGGSRIPRGLGIKE
jgi:hypothetical protein